MKSAVLLIAFLAAGLASGTAQASSGLSLVSNDPLANVATLGVTGSGNVLAIVQTHDLAGPRNTLSIAITGDLNGGPLGASFGGLPATLGLQPGHIEQSGHDNTIGLSVTGSQNLFAISQLGVGNTLTAMIIGNNNQAAISQTGTGNALSFTQNGNGNMLSVVQRAW